MQMHGLASPVDNVYGITLFYLGYNPYVINSSFLYSERGEGRIGRTIRFVLFILSVKKCLYPKSMSENRFQFGDFRWSVLYESRLLIIYVGPTGEM